MTEQTKSGTFSSVGVGDTIRVRHGESLTYTLGPSGAENFIGEVVLDKSEHGQGWTRLGTFTGTSAAPITSAGYSGTVRIEDLAGAFVRFACRDIDTTSTPTSAISDAILWSFSTVEDTFEDAQLVKGVIRNKDGDVLMRVKERSIEVGGTTINLDGSITLPSGASFSRSRQRTIPICGNAKVGATAGWVITAGTDICHATLPASQTASTLVVPIAGLNVGDTVTAVAVAGQVESAGDTVTLVMSVRKLTNAVAGNTDAELATDNVGNLAADTVLSATNLGVTGLSEVLAAGESLYVLLTGTTGTSTDIDLTHLLVTVTEA